MRKIDLTDYDVDGVKVSVKDNIDALVYGTEGLTGPKLLERHALAEKIKRGKEHVLLEEADWGVLNELVSNTAVFNKPFPPKIFYVFLELCTQRAVVIGVLKSAVYL